MHKPFHMLKTSHTHHTPVSRLFVSSRPISLIFKGVHRAKYSVQYLGRLFSSQLELVCLSAYVYQSSKSYCLNWGLPNVALELYLGYSFLDYGPAGNYRCMLTDHCIYAVSGVGLTHGRVPGRETSCRLWLGVSIFGSVLTFLQAAPEPTNTRSGLGLSEGGLKLATLIRFPAIRTQLEPVGI